MIRRNKALSINLNQLLKRIIHTNVISILHKKVSVPAWKVTMQTIFFAYSQKTSWNEKHQKINFHIISFVQIIKINCRWFKSSTTKFPFLFLILTFWPRLAQLISQKNENFVQELTKRNKRCLWMLVYKLNYHFVAISAWCASLWAINILYKPAIWSINSLIIPICSVANGSLTPTNMHTHTHTNSTPMQYFAVWWWPPVMSVPLLSHGKYNIVLLNWLPTNFSIRVIWRNYNWIPNRWLWWTGN